MHPVIALTSLTLLLAGCSDPPDPERARSVLPESERLQTLYQQSCQGCHARAGTGAPLTAHPSQWSARLNKGMDQLVESVVRGYGAMPPGGQCLECDRSDHRALIRFMSGSGDDA